MKIMGTIGAAILFLSGCSTPPKPAPSSALLPRAVQPKEVSEDDLRAIISAVQQRWYDLLEEQALRTAKGRVSLEVRFDVKGRVVDLVVVENSAGEVLGSISQKAVRDPAPYWMGPVVLRLTFNYSPRIGFLKWERVAE